MYSDKYAHLLQPLPIGGVILKNRMIASPSRPHFLQGPENYPSANAFYHYANKAKNGAAMVNISGLHAGSDPNGTKNHDGLFDFTDLKAQHYIAQLAEGVHYYGSKIQAGIGPAAPPGYDVSAGIAREAVVGDGSVTTTAAHELTEEMLMAMADRMVEELAILRYECGFDAAFLHMSYRGSVLGRLLSPLTNRRTDKFGGSLEARAHYILELCERIKQRCGRDFILEASISGHDPLDIPGGMQLEDVIDFAKMARGSIDILQVRAPDIDPSHPIPFELNPTPWLYMAEAIKKANTGVLVSAVGGFFDPAEADRVLAEGKADIIAMARAFISNPEYGRLVYEGRGGDLVPCLRCNKCHKSSWADPWISVCSVNPVWGIEDKLPSMKTEPTERKNIAVIGGGPAGMSAAIWLAERGHSVTLFERSGALGGQLDVIKDVPFKWTIRQFREYLIRQVSKQSGITVRLHCEPTREGLIAGGFSEVIAAIGAEPKLPPLEGIDQHPVVTALDAYQMVEQLGKQVVVIGGGEIGVETGMYLAQNGHEVTVLSRSDMLAKDSTPVHYYSMFQSAWEHTEGFSAITGAEAVALEAGAVVYRDTASGELHRVCFDSVVIAAGMKPRQAAALAYCDKAYGFHMIGDCLKVGNIQKLRRNAYGLAMQI